MTRAVNVKAAFWVVILASLVVRALFVLIFGMPPPILDAHEYDVMARNILAGRELDARPAGEPALPIRVPLYGYFVALVYWAFGAHPNAVVGVQIVLSTLLSALVFYLALRYCGDGWGAFAAAMLFAFHLPSAIHCGVLYPDTLFALLVGMSVVVTLRLLETATWPWALLTGSVLGLATLCKAAGQLMIALVVLLIFVGTKLSLKRRASLAVLAIVGFLVVMSPWVLRNYVKYNAFVPTGTLFGFNFMTGNYEELVPPEGVAKPALPPEMFKKAASMNWIEKDRYFTSQGVHIFVRNLSGLPRRALLKTGIILIDYPRLSLLNNIGYYTTIRPVLRPVIVWAGVVENSLYVLLALGAIVFCRSADRRLVMLVVLLMLYFLSGYILTRALSRYSLVLYPYICLFAGCVLSRLRVGWRPIATTGP